MQVAHSIYIISIVILLSACSNTNNFEDNFDYFHQQEDFNIATISLHKIAILGLIDDTKNLLPKERQQLTVQVFNSFADRVDAENLITTEDFAEQLGLIQYQQLFLAAKENHIEAMSQIMTENSVQNRYVLTTHLTQNFDHSEKNLVNDFLTSCRYYGRSIGLTMSILDIQNSHVVWSGHLDKNNKNTQCDDDDDDDDENWQNRNNHEKKEDAKGLLAGIIVGLLLTSIIEDSNAVKESLTANELSPMFKQAVNDFAKRLPSFYN